MDEAELNSTRLSTGAGRDRFALSLHRLIYAAFLLDLVLVALRSCLPGKWGGLSQVPEGLLVILAVAATLSSLARELPAQNVVLAAVVVALLSFGTDLLSAAVGLPFPQRQHPGVAGLRLVWAMPWIRVIELLNSRRVAQLLLRRWRPLRNHGLWVLALTVVLALVFETNLHAFAAAAGGYWSWNNAGTASGACGIPWRAAAAWTFFASAIAALITPSLINKRPGPTPPSWSQFCAWACANLLFLVGTASGGLWPSAALIGIELVAIGTLGKFRDRSGSAIRICRRAQ